MNIELLINGNKGIFKPTICGKVRCSSERWGAGYLKFKVLKEGSIDFKEGNCVSLRVDGKNMFYGYVFTKERTKEGVISVTCYDQMRYLKNRDSYVLSQLSANEIFSKICNDYSIKIGSVDRTGYSLPPRVEDNSTLFDILYNAISVTENMGYGKYIIYDDYGKLCFKNMKNMVSNLVVDKDTVFDFEYKTTIDKNVYNKIKLLYKRDTKYTSVRNEFVKKDDENIKNWGVLQYFSHIDINDVDGNTKATQLLNKYNVKNRSLKINTIGNVNIRAGWMVYVKLDIGDFVIDEYMRINKCEHIFDGNLHTMELDMEGGVLIE